eukprot:TRINITY_DN31570_c0_g1_i3.p1 TRINITY_DN31570_c0_g1~~TRINITY_DN31570_c0_g1_i3.p1  ORF type:complete len:676 (+),score=46.09 TRINITY_DN31570_c0_g1_i3:1818-3845(+)
MKHLQILSVANNSFTGPFPEVRGLPQLRDIAAHCNRFTGAFPDISGLKSLDAVFVHGNMFQGSLPALPHSARTVLMHGNLFSGGVDKLGSKAEHLQLLLALAGNYLSGSVGNAALSTHEPLLHGRSTSTFLVSEDADLRKALALIGAVAVCGLLCVLLLLGFHRGDTTAAKDRAVTFENAQVLATLRRCQRMLGLQCGAALVCFGLYRSCENLITDEGTVLRSSAAYARGAPMVFAYGIVVLFNGFCILWIRRFPYNSAHPQQARRTWFQTVTAWAQVVCLILVCSSPSLLNSILDCYPTPWVCLLAVKPYLPLISTALTVNLLPRLLRMVAKATSLPADRLNIMRGLGTWVLPCAVLVVLSQDCYGMWWRFLEECGDSNEWSCSARELYRGFPRCVSATRFDIPSNWVFNGSHWLQDYFVTTRDICDMRWANPSKCTTRLLEVVGMFIFMKLLTASLVPLVLLLISTLGKTERTRFRFPNPLPVGVVRREGGGIERLDLVLWLPHRSRESVRSVRLLRLSEKFSPLEVLQRVAVWVDLALGWGLLHPPTALAGFLYVSIEAWTYGKAVSILNLQWTREQQQVQLPKAMMGFWIAMMGVFAAVHFVFATLLDPSWTILLLVLSWLCSYCIWRCERRDRSGVDAFELAVMQASTVRPANQSSQGVPSPSSRHHWHS